MILAELRLEDDRVVVAVRRAARLLGEGLGLSTQNQTRFAAAASEVARAARERGLEALRFCLHDCRLVLEVDGLDESDVTVGRMVDRTRAVDGTFTLEKHLTGPRPDEDTLEALKLRLLTADPRSAAEEIRRQNTELLRALEEQRAAEEALRRSEERLRQAITATRLGTWELSDRWTLSPRAQELFGVGDAHASPMDSLTDEDRERFESAVAELRAKGTPLELELELGPESWVVVRALVQNGSIVGTVLDVSERRKREEEARVRAELEKLLVGVVSHDLRSPLSTLKMGVQMLEGADLDEMHRTVLQRMESSVDGAARLVHDLLDFTEARLGGGIAIEPSERDGHALVDEVLGEMRVANPDREIRHDRQGPGRAPLDTERFKQVVLNLVSNALQHSPADTAVRVETANDGECFHLRVHNAGAPIPPDEIGRVFEPLRKGAGSRGKGSLGLGLFIVRHVVQSHGGSVSVASDEASGTTFSVAIPLAPQEAEDGR